MNTRSASGIVLRITEHGEADKLVTLYCPDLGRVTGIAKGAKKSSRRFVNKLEEFSLLNIFYRPPRKSAGLLLISEAELLSAHLSLRTDFRKYIAAIYFCELILRFTRENDPDPQVYDVLEWVMTALHQDKSPQQTVAFAHLHLLERMGYRPDLTRCIGCRQPVGPGRSYTFLPGSGALLCSACSPRYDAHSLRLSVQTLRLLASAQAFQLDRLHRLQCSRQTLAEAMGALHLFTVHLLQQDVHSWSIFQSLIREQHRPSPDHCRSPHPH